MKQLVLTLVILMLAMFVAHNANASHEEYGREPGVIGIGHAPLAHCDSVERARAIAIREALADAIAQGEGVTVRSTSEVVNFELRTSRVETEVTGSVARYDILDEWQDQDVYTVKLWVQTPRDFAASCGLEERRYGVLYEGCSTPENRIVLRDVVEAMGEWNLRVVGEDFTIKASGGASHLEILAFARGHEADTVLVIEAHDEVCGRPMQDRYVMEAELSARVYDGCSGEPIGQARGRGKGPRLEKHKSKGKAYKGASKKMVHEYVMNHR